MNSCNYTLPRDPSSSADPAGENYFRLPNPYVFCFFACLMFHDFLIFSHANFIDFWTSQILKYAAYSISKSIFSCCEKVMIVHAFWPPKMMPKAWKGMIFGLLKYWDFLFFRYTRFAWNAFIPKREHHFWGSGVRAVFWKFMIFHVFLSIAFFRRSGDHFFRFRSVPGTSQIDPDPSKVVLLLKRDHDFQKIMFFLEIYFL